jgi:hypothetical protein
MTFTVTEQIITHRYICYTKQLYVSAWSQHTVTQLEAASHLPVSIRHCSELTNFNSFYYNEI